MQRQRMRLHTRDIDHVGLHACRRLISVYFFSQGAWLLMLETDYVWIKPVMAPGSAYDSSVPGLSFFYDYINPQWPGVDSIMKEMCPGCNVAKIPHSGPAPVLMRFSDLKKATPAWEKFSNWIETTPTAKKKLDWVREMFAWCAAVENQNLNLVTEPPPLSRLMAQPPHDHQTGNASIFHYTWGSIYMEDGKEVWKFDKRFYTAQQHAWKPPRLEEPPAWRHGLTLQDRVAVTEPLHDTVAAMIRQMNLAIDTLPDMTPH